MKSYKTTILITLILLLNAALLNAHALYIDTDATGKTGKRQEVKIYYSEFEDRSIEKVADWYSDVASFELWLIQPDGSRQQLSTAAKNDHFVSAFTPDKKGKYRLEISHTAEDPGDGTAYQFNAFAEVLVGNASGEPVLSRNVPDLLLVEHNQPYGSKTKVYRTFLKGKPAANISTTVFLPSGDKKTITSNADGELALTLEEKGTYFLEATSFHKEESGKTKKAPYASVWRCATQKIEVL